MEEKKDLTQKALEFLKRDESGVYTEQDIVKAMVDFHELQMRRVEEHADAIKMLTAHRWPDAQKAADEYIKKCGGNISIALSQTIHNLNNSTLGTGEQIYWWKMRNILNDRLDEQGTI